MSTKRIPVPVEKRYPTLRFLVGVYKIIGALILAGSILFGLGQMALTAANEYGSLGVMTGLGTILSGFSIGALCWLIAEGVEVFIDIEKNTRQIAHELASGGSATSAAKDSREITAQLESVVRLLDVVTVYQQQTTQQIDALTTAIHAMHADLETGGKTLDIVAESSKAVATILYRQSVNHG